MHLKDFFLLKPEIYRFQSLDKYQVDPLEWKGVEEVFLALHGDDYYISRIGKACSIRALEDASLIRRMVAWGNTLWLMRRVKSNIFDLQAVETEVRLGVDLKIGVDEGVVERLVEERLIQTPDINLALKWLTEEFSLIERKDKQCLFAAYYQNRSEADFQIIGRRWSGGISSPKTAASRLVKLNRLAGQQMIPCILEGSIEFVDFSTEQGRIFRTLGGIWPN
jgi:hypothetical protein